MGLFQKERSVNLGILQQKGVAWPDIGDFVLWGRDGTMMASMQLLDLTITGLTVKLLQVRWKVSAGWPGVVAYTCNPATLEVKFWNSVGSVPVRNNSPSICGWIV